MAIKEKEPSEQFIAHTVSGYKPKRRPWNLSPTPQAPESVAPVAEPAPASHPKTTPAEKAGVAESAGADRSRHNASPALSAGSAFSADAESAEDAEKASPAFLAGDASLAAPAEKAEDRRRIAGDVSASPTKRAGDQPRQAVGPAKESRPAERAPLHYTQDRGAPTSALNTLGWKLPEGASRFTRVPHSFTDCLEKEEFSHREYRLLMLLLRETLGWGRACVVLRSKELLDRTRIPERHLRDTIKALQGRGVIFVEDRRTDGGQSLPSAFALNPKYFEKHEPPAVSAGDAQPARAAESAGSSLAQTAGESPRPKSEGRRTGIDSNSSRLHHETGGLKKEVKKEQRNSLSQDRPTAWTEFTSQLTEKARERADRVFESLKRGFPADPIEEIAACPKNLERFGAPDGTPWEKINSPIGLMESSWPQLRDFFRKKGEEARKAEVNRYSAEEDRELREKIDRELAEEQQRRREAFLAAFPDAEGRREVVQKYLGDLPFKPDGPIGQGIAIGKWWDESRGGVL